MPVANVLVYGFASGDSTYPHSGNFTVNVAGKIAVDDSNGFGDLLFGDWTHTGSSDVPDQTVVSSTVAGINTGNTVDVRYKYAISGSDGSSGTIYFLATNSTNNYGPLFASDFPLVTGVTYSFDLFNTDGAVPYSSLVPCFTSGTLILTARGERPIDTLQPGDRICTRDNGPQPLRWIGGTRVPAVGAAAPVRIARGLLGNTRDLLVSPNHRMLIAAAAADFYFAEPEVLVPAKHLLGNDGVSRPCGGWITYIHLLFDRHQVITANGAPSESFFPGQVALTTLDHSARAEVLGLFPELDKGSTAGFPEMARACLSLREASLLALPIA